MREINIGEVIKAFLSGGFSQGEMGPTGYSEVGQVYNIPQQQGVQQGYIPQMGANFQQYPSQSYAIVPIANPVNYQGFQQFPYVSSAEQQKGGISDIFPFRDANFWKGVGMGTLLCFAAFIIVNKLIGGRKE